MTTVKFTRLAFLLFGLAWIPAASAHPGHAHESGWLAGLMHSVTGWDQLLILFAVAAVGVYCLSGAGRR